MITGTEHDDAARIAAEAGQALLTLRRRLEGGEQDVREICAEADRLSHDVIVGALAAAYPHDAILSEEGIDNPARLSGRRVWIVDPLDGTREFGEAERTDWAVHVALAVDGAPVVGAVALPARGLVLTTASLPPAAPASSRRRIRLVVSRSRPPAIARALAAHLHAEVIAMGSAGAKTMAVVLGEADIYLHAGGQYEWDSAAPVAVAAAAGLHASRIDGTALRYNRPDPWLPDQLVCRRDLAGAVLGALGAISPREDGSSMARDSAGAYTVN